MPKESLAGHIKRCHMGKADDCLERLKTELGGLSANLANMEKLANEHPLQATLGMIRLDKLTDDEFNGLLDENRIYAKNGHLFRK